MTGKLVGFYIMFTYLHSKSFHVMFLLFYRSLGLWSAMKKKPLHIKELAHGKSTENSQANWISAVATLINTDIVASGELEH